MKRIGLVLSFALLLTGSATAYGHWGFCCGPSLSFGIGLSPFFGCSFACSPGYCYGYPAYCYAYSRPSYPYYPAVPSVPAPAPAMRAPPAPYVQAQPQAPDPPSWVPSTPGAGKWIPDPTPYRYTPPPVAQRSAQRKSSGAPIVSILRSSEGIPVYFVSH